MSLSFASDVDITAACGRIRAIWADIPLVAAMRLELDRLDETGVLCSAPMEANRNHRGIAFGGSLQAMATLAGHALAVALSPVPEASVVIHDGRMHFQRPGRGARLVAVASMPDAAVIDRYRAAVLSRGRGRIAIAVRVEADGETCAQFEGAFAARSMP